MKTKVPIIGVTDLYANAESHLIATSSFAGTPTNPGADAHIT